VVGSQYLCPSAKMTDVIAHIVQQALEKFRMYRNTTSKKIPVGENLLAF